MSAVSTYMSKHRCRLAATLAAFAGILEEFRHRYLLSYRPEGVTAGGWHQIEVRVRRPGVTVRARAGYLSSQ